MRRNKLHLRIYFVSLLILFTSVAYLSAQDTINPYSVQDTIAIGMDLFAEEDPASITLIYDIKEFMRNRGKDEYSDARLIYHLNDSIDIEKEIRLKTRGKNRQETCAFPPLWLNIRKADIQNKYLKETVRIKMVTHCAGSTANLDYVLKEFLIYKMYNLISPYSFRVRLVKVNYIDTGRKNKEYNSWGFFIEPEEMMAERLDALPLDSDRIGSRMTDPEATDLMCVFQYMIGNADYSIAGRHNVKLLKLKDHNSIFPIPVPYDFDYTGFVDAFYAIPGENLGITSVTQRYFLGPCRTEETFTKVIQYIAGKKEDLYKVLDSFEYMNEKEIKIARKYLEEFFNNAGKPGYVEKDIMRTCRQ